MDQHSETRKQLPIYESDTHSLCFGLCHILWTRLKSLAIPGPISLHHEIDLHVQNKGCVFVPPKKQCAIFFFFQRKKKGGWGGSNFSSGCATVSQIFTSEVNLTGGSRCQMGFCSWTQKKGKKKKAEWALRSIAYLSITVRHFSQHLNKLTSALYQPACINSISLRRLTLFFPKQIRP